MPTASPTTPTSAIRTGSTWTRSPRWTGVRSERGQDTIELAGALVVVSIIVAIVVALFTGPLGATLRSAITCTVEKILDSGSCGASPGLGYVTSTETKTAGWNGRVFIVDGGHQFTVTETHYSNGTTTISLQNQVTGGLSVQVGLSAELGHIGLNLDAAAGGGIYGQGSATWTFRNAKAAQAAWSQLTQGSGAGTAAHDFLSGVPFAGTALNVVGLHGAPTVNSVNHRYLTSQGYGGGIQASANASASADIPGVVDAGISAKLGAQGGFGKITSGADAGDWIGNVMLNGDANGDLAGLLTGGDASGDGNFSGSIQVIFSPSGTPLSLVVTGDVQGLWDVQAPDGTPNAPSRTDVPGSGEEPGHDDSGTGAASGSGEGGAEKGAEGTEPLLSLENDSSDNSGDGTSFTGTIDLQSDPSAAAAVTSVLHGNLSDIPTVIEDMNTSGTESVQNYKVTTSSSSFGGSVSVGVGGGASENNSTSSTTDSPPTTRVDGGPWSKQ